MTTIRNQSSPRIAATVITKLQIAQAAWIARLACLLVGAACLGLAAPALVGADSPRPNQVWVDDDYTAATPGWGVTNFNTLQAGIAAVAERGTVHVLPGTYKGVKCSKKVRLEVSPGAIIEGASPAITVDDGSELELVGGTLQVSSNEPVVLVIWGTIRMRGVTVNESQNYDQSAIKVIGTTNSVDLGTVADSGTNVFNIRGAGSFIYNTGGGPIPAIGNTWKKDDVAGTSNFDIEDKIFHALDAGGSGLVTWVANNVYVTTNSGSIQRAIDAVSTGDTVNVAAGLYNEPVNLENRNNLTIQGVGRDSVTVKPSVPVDWGLGYGSSRQTALRIVNSDDFALKGVTLDCDLIKGDYRYGFLYWNSTGGLFENNRFKNMSKSNPPYYDMMGYLRGADGTCGARDTVTIRNNEFIDTGRLGLVTHDYLHSVIEGNTFAKTTDAFGYAMEIGSASTAEIRSNVIYGFDFPAPSDGSSSGGIYVENCFTTGVPACTKNVVVEDNEIYGCQWGLIVGNEFYSYAGPVGIVAAIRRNNIHNNTDGGVILADADNSLGSSVSATMLNNEIRTNGAYGIYAYAGSSGHPTGGGTLGVSITNCTITGHTDSGFVLDEWPSSSTYSVSLSQNDLSGNVTGVYNYVAGVPITAIGNWWGCATGPAIASNPGGSGVGVAGDVDFSPWLGDGTDTSADIGFQPNLTPVYYTPTGAAFTTQPVGANLGSPLSVQPVVTVTNEIGGVALQYTNLVTLTIGNNPGSGVLTGTNPKYAAAGVATFTDLAITVGGGAGYTLVASSLAPLPAVTSSTFDIANPAPTISSLNPFWTRANSGLTSITVTGTGFVPTSVVRWNGDPRTTHYSSDTQLTMDFEAGDIGSPTVAQMKVSNVAPAADTTELPFRVEDATPDVVYVDDGFAGLPNDATTAWPCATGPGTPCPGSHIIGYDAFATVQAAVNAVAANGLVKVADGLYKESNTTVTNAMTIEGQTRAGVVIAPAAEDSGDGWSSTAGSPQNGLIIDADNVTVRTLTVDGNANNLTQGGTLPNHYNFRQGIRLALTGVERKNITVDQVNVFNVRRRGINLYPTTGYLGPYSVTDSTVAHVEYQNAIGIGSVNATVTGNTVDDANNAISLFPGGSGHPDPNATAIISGNTITNLGHVRHAQVYPPTGIYYRNPNTDRKVIAENNTISAANNVAAAMGFYIYNANDQSRIASNQVDLSGQTTIDPYVPPPGPEPYADFAWVCPLGINLSGCAGATAQDNTITLYGTGAGIYLGRGAATAPVPNQILHNAITTTFAASTALGQSYGIASSDDPNFDVIGESQSSTDNVLSQNTISGFVRGILLQDVNTYTVSATISDDNSIVGSTTFTGETYGVQLLGAQATIMNNSASFTGNAVGIEVDGGKALLQNNTITNNTAAGIRVKNGATVDAGNCGGTDVTGLGISTGGNDLAGYGYDNAAPWAIENLNTSAQPGVLARNNKFGATVATDDIEQVLYDDSDAPGNSAVIFTQGPLLVNCPSAVNVECIGQVPPGATSLVSFLAQAGAAVAGNSVTVSASDVPPIAPETVTIRTYTISDGCNTTTCNQTITVDDVTPPTITCPGNVTVNADAGICTASGVALGSPTVGDNCAVASVVSNAPATFPLGNTTVTWTVTDTGGLTATCPQTVTVVDNQPPVPVCKNIAVTLDADGRATIVPADVYQSGSDNCGSVNLVSVEPSSFTFCNVGANSVTLTVNDGHGNTATCTATVTVNAPAAAPAVVYVDAAYGTSCAEVTFPATGGTGQYYIGYNAFKTVQAAINAVAPDGTVNVAAGTYGITNQILISKSVSIVGDPVNRPVVQANAHFDPDYHPGTTYYMLRGVAGVTATINIRYLVLDGNGYDVYGAMRFNDTHSGTVEDCVFQHVKEPTGSQYLGIGIVSDGSLTIRDNVFTDIGRVGIWVGTSANTVTRNVYTGKGAGDWIDYGIEVGYGGIATITSNTIVNCKGIADSDGSGSAAILVTDYYGLGTQATISNNTLTNNTGGIAVGYDADDASVVVAHNNDLSGNTDYGIDTLGTVLVDGTSNWWGSPTGPTIAANPGGNGVAVSANVTFSPWLGDGTDTSADIGFQPNLTPVYYTPTGLTFSTQPVGANLGSPLLVQPVVTVTNEIGGVALQYTNLVTLTIGNNPGDGVLTGTNPKYAVAGVTTFTNLAITVGGGAGYTFVASSLSPLPAVASSSFDITNAAPTISSLSPFWARAGGSAFSLTVNGADFVANSVVYWNGNTRTTHYVLATQVTADISAGDIASVGTAPVKVVSPAPGGGETAELPFRIEAATPTVVYVDTNYVGMANDTLVNWPYTEAGTNIIGYDAFATIQGGVDAVAVGGTVNVAAGTYTENVFLAESVRLMGAGSSATTINANNVGNGVTITASDIEVRGFRVTGGWSTNVTVVYYAVGGIVVEGNGGATNLTGVKIEDNVVEQNAGNGIYVSAAGHEGAATNVVIRNCRVNNNGTVGPDGAGISLTYPNYNVRPVGVWDEWRRPKNVLVEGNTIYSNAAYGVYVSAGRDVVIRTNEVFANSKYGLQLTPSWNRTDVPCEYTVVTDNSIHDNVRNGVKLTSYNQYNTFTRNSIYSNGAGGSSAYYKYGFLFQDGNNNVISNNTITGNALGGLYLWGQGDPSYTWYSTTSNTIAGNFIANHTAAGGHGILVPAKATNPNSGFLKSQITGNSITNNAAFGVENLDTTQTIDASANWWGVSTSAGVAAQVSSYVDYTPWLDVGTDTSANAGFQGDFSILWVDEASPQTGSKGRLQEAHDLTSGSKVIVAAGTYAEHIVITNDNFRLVAQNYEGSDARLARTPALESVLSNATAAGTIQIDGADNLVIDGLTILNTAKGVHVVNSADNVTVRNVRLDTASADGINLWRATSATVLQNYLKDVTLSGITAGDDAGALGPDGDIVTTALITENKVVNARFGITGYQTGSTIAFNEVSGFTATGTAAGVGGQFYNVLIASNTVSSYAQTDQAGVALTALFTPNRAAPSGVTVANNAVSGSYAGIFVGSDTASNIKIVTNNNVTACAAGVAIQGAATVKDNAASVTGNGVGIFVSGSSAKALIENNNLAGNTAAAIRAELGATVDAGDCNGGNVTGLGTGGGPNGSSAGLNDLSGYGFDNAAPWAIENLNTGGPAVLAYQNSFGAVTGDNLEKLFSGVVQASQSGAVLLVSAPPDTNVQCLASVPEGATTLAQLVAQGGAVSATPVTVAFSDIVVSNSPNDRVITRTYVVADVCGQAGTNVQTITVDDTQSPAISGCPADRTLNVGGQCNVAVPDMTGEVVANDNCGPIAITQNPVAGTLISLGTNTVTMTVADAGGNSAQCNVTLTVVDTNPAPYMTYVDDDYAGLPAGTVVLWPAVGGSGPHYIGCDAFAAVQAAVDRVAAGGTVNVAAGTYTAGDRALGIIRKSLSLIGSGQTDDTNGTVLSGGTYGTSQDVTGLGNNYPRAIVVQTNNVAIRNLRIKEYQGDTVTYAGYGIVARAESSWGTAVPVIENLIVEQVTFDDVSYGLRSQVTLNMLVQSNTYTIGGGVPEYAFYLRISTNTVVRANTVTGGSIWVTAARNAAIGGPDVSDGNTVHDSVYNGIWLGQQFAAGTSSDGYIQNNSVLGCEEGGIVIWNWPGEVRSDIRILDNVVTGAKSTTDYHGGISVWQGSYSNLIVCGNASTNNAKAGLSLSSTDWRTGLVASNLFAVNSGPGIRLNSVTRGTDIGIRFNAMESNGAGGLTMSGGSGPVLDASANWWGDNVPSAVVTQVSTNVDYTPWLDVGTDTSTNAGFQGDFSKLHVAAASPQAGATGRIQEGVNLVSGSTVYVHAGTYNESQVLIAKAVQLLGDGAATTIIDAGGGTGLASAGTVRITATSDVTVDGVTVRNPKSDTSASAVRVGIYASSATAGNTYRITHNKIIGSGNPADAEDYGFYSHSGREGLVFQYNEITGCGANSILLERHYGPSDVSWNTFDRGVANTANDAYFNMNYGGAALTTLQKVSHNTIDMGNDAGPYDNAHRGFAITFAGSYTGSDAGGYSNVQITDNIITNLNAYRRGIGLWNNAPGDGSLGDITGAVIAANQIIGTGATGSQGVRVLGRASNAAISSNSISAVDIGVRQQAWNGHAGVATLIGSANNIGGAGTGIVIETGIATIKDNASSITGNSVGILVSGGTAKALIENNNLTNNTSAGIRVELGATMDGGDCTGGNVTGLGTGSGPNGSSAGLNDLSGYGFDNTSPWAVEDLNSSAQPAVLAMQNNFGGTVGQDIGLVLYDEADNPALSAVVYSQSGGIMVSCPPPVSEQCPGSVPAAATNIAQFVAQGGVVSCNSGTVTFSDGPLTPGPYEGTVTRTYTISDECGQTDTCIQIVTVDDTIAPAIVSCPTNRTLLVDNNCTVALPDIMGEVVATDNCGLIDVTQYPPANTPLSVGTTNVIFTVADRGGNATNCSAQITVIDTMAPSITCPPALLDVPTDPGECHASLTNVTLGVPITSDNCAVASVTNNAPAQFPKGDTIVIWTVADASGNTNFCAQTVTVKDHEAPTIDCPANVTVNTDSGQCCATGVVLGSPITSDNCGVASVTNDAPSQYPVGATVVTWTVTDTSGNTNNCVQMVTVVDNQPPVIDVITATQAQPEVGTVSVKNCTNATLQGRVDISVQASDQCALSAPTINLTNGAFTATASFENENPAGTFNYTWDVTTNTANGTWTATVAARDSTNTTTATFTLCVNKSQVTGRVELQDFAGTNRVITFVATDGAWSNATVLKTWTLTLTFTNTVPATNKYASYLLTDVPSSTAGISAKTDWNLRRKVAVTPDSNGQAVADFTGAARLKGGDIALTGISFNAVILDDYAALVNAWLGTDPVADINGDGVVNVWDYSILASNWYTTGDPQ